jgi:hypothetical protein
MRARNAAIVAITLLVGFATYLYGLVFEYEYPYLWTLHRARAAHAPGGEPIGDVIRRHLGPEVVHWHVCSYCAHLAHANGVISLELHTRRGIYLLAFDSRNDVIVPMSELSASTFPRVGSAKRKTCRAAGGDQLAG